MPPIPAAATGAVSSLLSAASFTEFAYLTPRGEPLCWPVTPYWYPQRGVLGIATGLAYPNKAYYARRHPKVSALFEAGATQVLLQGDAVVLDEDLQANTDRYIREMRAKFASARVGLNPLTLRLLDFYLPRLWIEVTPVRVASWTAPDRPAPGNAAPPSERPSDRPGRPGSDPPSGRTAGNRASEPEVRALQRWVRRSGRAVVTLAGQDGYPAMSRGAVLPGPGGCVELEDAPGVGSATLTLCRQSLGGVRLDALMARGWVVGSGPSLRFIPRRVVGFFGAEAGSPPPLLSIFPLSQLPRAGAFRSTLTRELSRRGVALPHLRVPR